MKYTEEHEWIVFDGREATVGITDHAAEQLGDLVFVELPEVGDLITRGSTFGSVESVKAVEDMYAPISGEVVEVNQSVLNDPEALQNDPHGDGWLLKIRLSNSSELDQLMDSASYSNKIAAN